MTFWERMFGPFLFVPRNSMFIRHAKSRRANGFCKINRCALERKKQLAGGIGLLAPQIIELTNLDPNTVWANAFDNPTILARFFVEPKRA